MPQLTKRTPPRPTGVMLVKIDNAERIASQKKGTPAFQFTYIVVDSPEPSFVGNKIMFQTFWLPKDEDIDNPKYARMINDFIDFVAAISGQQANEGDSFDPDSESFIPSLLEETVTVQIENDPYDGADGKKHDSYRTVAWWPADQYDTQVSIYRDQVNKQIAAKGERF